MPNNLEDADVRDCVRLHDDHGADHSTFLSLPKSTREAAGVRVFRPVTGFWPVAVAFTLRSVETWRIN